MKNKLAATISYIVMIVALNMAFVYLPGFGGFGRDFSPADLMVGAIYLVRDFAQREIRHWILAAMAIGAVLSYWLASPAIAYASAAGFIAGELIDWLIFTFSGKPLSQRLLISSIASAPFDSIVFLTVAGRLSWLQFSMMTLGKFIGVLVLFILWRTKKAASKDRYKTSFPT